ncbi:MAG: hypothetical protein HUJ62_05835, partial [Streptococcus gallolyticus]|nr:hypothetical protein [Streptococcus gallolyticus]
MIPKGKLQIFKPTGYSKLLSFSFATYAVIFTLSTLVTYSASILDNIFSGIFLGEEAIAAIGIISPLNTGVSGLVLLVPYGALVISAQALGKKDVTLFRQTFSLSIVLSFILGIVLALVIYFGAELFAGIFCSGDSDTIHTIYVYVVEYLKIYAFMIPFYCLVNNFVAISRLDSNPKLSLIVSACLPASNILFKFIFIQLNWGMQGIALSTVLSCVFVTLISATHFLTKNNHFKFILPKDFIAKRTINIIKYGSSELNSEISTFLFGIVANLILVTFVGPVGLVAYSILSNIEMVGSSLHYGVNQAASYISALLFGEEDKDGVRQGLLLGVSSGFILTFLFALCVLLFPNIFVSFFGLTNPDAYNTTIFAISIYALIIPLDAV